jgi:hypothetical protein
MKTIGQGMEGHGSTLVKYEISLFSQYREINIMRSHLLPTISARKKVDSHRNQRLVINATCLIDPQERKEKTPLKKQQE